MSKELADRLKQALKTRGANQRQLAVVDEILGLEKKPVAQIKLPDLLPDEIEEIELDD